MDEPILQLLVEKGRRKGESVECMPGAALRLGRVVRGDTFAVRDPGVSQKHLSFEFLREASRWAVTDLDTSNGTVLNGSQIAPSVPVPLSDGDSIKIGETTYISVKIAGGRPRTAAEEEAAVVRLGRRRGGAPPLPPARSEAEMPLGSAVDQVSEASVANDRGRGRGRGRGRERPRRAAAASAGVSIKDEMVDAVAVEESVPEVKGRARGRRPATRVSSVLGFQRRRRRRSVRFQQLFLIWLIGMQMRSKGREQEGLIQELLLLGFRRKSRRRRLRVPSFRLIWRLRRHM